MIEAELFLNQIPDYLMPILLDVLPARDVYPKVFAVGGLDDGLVEVGVLDDPVEPAVQNLLVGMGDTIFPLRVRCLRNLDVGSFAKGVLGGIDATDFHVELNTTIYD